MVASSAIAYRRSLTLGQRFEISTRLLGWDLRCAYLEQTFCRGDEHVARGVVAGRSSRGAAPAPAPDVLDLLGPTRPLAPSCPPTSRAGPGRRRRPRGTA